MQTYSISHYLVLCSAFNAGKSVRALGLLSAVTLLRYGFAGMQTTLHALLLLLLLLLLLCSTTTTTTTTTTTYYYYATTLTVLHSPALMIIQSIQLLTVMITTTITTISDQCTFPCSDEFTKSERLRKYEEELTGSYRAAKDKYLASLRGWASSNPSLSEGVSAAINNTNSPVPGAGFSHSTQQKH